jgi:nitrogen fixation NifU-like protein
MMNLRDLYQEVIVDHNRNPHHHYEIENPDCFAQGFNPLCGDKINLFLKMENDRIVDVGFIGNGCAISTASASLMTDALVGKSINEANDLFTSFHEAIVENKTDSCKNLGKLAVFEGVKAFPSRVKCATLAWHTLQAALRNEKKVVATE